MGIRRCRGFGQDGWLGATGSVDMQAIWRPPSTPPWPRIGPFHPWYLAFLAFLAVDPGPPRLPRIAEIRTLACACPFAESHLRPLSLLLGHFPSVPSHQSLPSTLLSVCLFPAPLAFPLPRSFNILFSNRRRFLLDLGTRKGICPVSHFIFVSCGFEASESLEQ